MKRLLIVLAVVFMGGASVHGVPLKFEGGRVDAQGGDNEGFTDVFFTQVFDVAPVVIATPTRNGSDPASIRIRNVTSTGFQIVVVEPPGEDGAHADMNVTYFALEPGVGRLGSTGGPLIQAGTIDTTTAIGKSGIFSSGAGGFDGVDNISFGESFNASPALLTTIQTMNNESANLLPNDPSTPFLNVTVETGSVSTTGANVALERGEIDDTGENASDGINGPETIGFIAIEQSNGLLATDNAGLVLFDAFDTGITIPGSVNGTGNSGLGAGEDIPFNVLFSGIPGAVAGQTSRVGADGSWVRIGNADLATMTSLRVVTDEDQFTDDERGHADESASIFAFDFNGQSVIIGSLPVPEPTTAMLCGVAVVGLISRRRRSA